MDDRHPHKAYQDSHRMPRLLIVANKVEQHRDGFELDSHMDWLVHETDCNCMKFDAKGPNNVHLLVPKKYQQSSLNTVKNVFQQSVKEDRPYDAHYR